MKILRRDADLTRYANARPKTTVHTYVLHALAVLILIALLPLVQAALGISDFSAALGISDFSAALGGAAA